MIIDDTQYRSRLERRRNGFGLRAEDFRFIVVVQRSEDETDELKSGTGKAPAEQVIKDFRCATRNQYSEEEEIRIVLEGLRSEESSHTIGLDEYQFASANGFTSYSTGMNYPEPLSSRSAMLISFKKAA